MTYPIKILATFMFPVTTYAGKWAVPEGAPPGTAPVIVEGGRQEEHDFVEGATVEDLDLATKRLFVGKGLAEWIGTPPPDETSAPAPDEPQQQQE